MGRTLAGPSRVETGVDMLGVAIVTAQQNPGDHLFEWHVSPLETPSTRLSQVASLWQRWRPRRLRLEIVPAASAMVGGSYQVAWSADPTYHPTTGELGLRELMALTPSITSTLWSPTTLELPVETVQKWLYVLETSEDTRHGTVYVMVVSPLQNAVGRVTLSIKLHWEVEFEMYNLSSANLDEAFIPTDSQPVYQGYLATVGPWALWKHADGTPAATMGLRSGVVYMLATRLTQDIKCATADGKVDNARYLVAYKWSGRYYPAMFRTQEEAEDGLHGKLLNVANKEDKGSAASAAEPGPIRFVPIPRPRALDEVQQLRLEVRRLQQQVADLQLGLERYSRASSPASYALTGSVNSTPPIQPSGD